MVELVNSIRDRQLCVVTRYATTDLPLATLLRDTPEPHGSLIQALSYIEDCLRGKRLARDAIRAAQAVSIDGANPELLILMLSYWAELSCRIARHSEAEALVQRAQALVSDKTRPEAASRVTLIRSILADANGDKAARERMLRAIVDDLPKSSGRHKFYAWELYSFLGQQGRGTEFLADMENLEQECNKQFPRVRLRLVQFVNAVETGDTMRATPLLNDIDPEHERLETSVAELYSKYRALLSLIVDDSTSAAESNKFTSKDSTPWTLIVQALIGSDAQRALRLARLEAGKLLGSICASGFDSFNLVRAELAAGNGEAARRLLDMRSARGNSNYLDDFFLARVELLAENNDAAIQAFSRVLASTDYYCAQGRLNFELEMSCDLSRGAILRLARVAQPSPAATARSTARPHHVVPNSTEPSPDALSSIVGQTEAISNVRKMITQFANMDVPVLVTGETGVGKEVVARALHSASERKDRPFIAVNCGAIAETLLESELFGHKRGAFTGAERANKGLFEEAGTGTILLDEIGDIQSRLQTALLRVLETGEIRAVGSTKTRTIQCRIILATNADLERLSQDGRFRKDLMFRLQRLDINVPPLRERRGDILPLTRHFLDAGRREGLHAVLSDELADSMRAYGWPGNVRELKNVVERMRLMHSDKMSYALEDIDIKLQGTADRSAAHLDTGIADISRSQQANTAAGGHSHLHRTPPALHESSTRVNDILKHGRTQIRRLDVLRELFAEHGKMTRSEVIRILGVSANTATKDLKALIDERYIERITPSASTRSHYFVLARQEEEDGSAAESPTRRSLHSPL